MNSNRLAPIEFLSSANPQDEYELIQRIGSGTYGEVYKARHTPTAAMRALKVIKLEPGDDFNIIQQEILMMIQCTHPNIISYFGSYLKRDKLWIAMELCSGGSMQDIYHVYGPLNETQIAYILKETLKGLDYLHQNGKMHRDIKGANILLTDDGNVKLADFGVAASITATIGKRKSFIGTPYWMAPEVAAVERKGGYNHLCDIWAVGITGIEFAELQPPMFDLHPMRALFLMSKSGFKPPTLKDKAKWSVSFQSFLKDALTKNPKKRPSADRLLEHPFVQGSLTAYIARDLLDRLRNGTTSNNSSLSEDRDDEDEDRSIFQPPKKITSTKDGTAVSSSSVRPLVANLVQTPLIRSSVLDDDDQIKSSSNNLDQGTTNLEHMQRLQALGIPDRDIYRLMAQSPLKAFQNLTLNEIQHIIDVMREADVDDSDEPTTIKRAPTSNSNHLDTNNNSTLKRMSSQSNAIPNVPKVHMGAGFMKIFNQCPLEIYSSTCWINHDTEEQHVLIAAEEGIYALNLNEIHDTTLELLYPHRTTWLFVKDNILWSISGKSSSLYRHDLVLLMQHKICARSSLPLNKTQIQQKFEKLMSKKLSISVKIINTRGCTRCAVGRNQFNGFIYLAGLLPNEIFLMQYYEPLRKFMNIKNIQLSLGMEPRIFELIFSRENDYAYVCFGVSRSKSLSNSFKFAWINFETEAAENCHDVTLLPNVSQIIQHEKDADKILICQDNRVKIIDSLGKLRLNSPQISELRFDYNIQSLVCLQDSVLAFHEHGMQGRGLKDNEITQEVHDETRTFRVICRDRMIVLQSRTLNSTSSDLHILMGHEST